MKLENKKLKGKKWGRTGHLPMSNSPPNELVQEMVVKYAKQGSLIKSDTASPAAGVKYSLPPPLVRCRLSTSSWRRMSFYKVAHKEIYIYIYIMKLKNKNKKK